MTWRPWPADVGRVRSYPPGDPPTIYPGEVMVGEVDDATIDICLRAAVLSGCPHVEIEPTWTVSPAPGWRAFWYRCRYRLTWWMPWGGPAQLVATARVRRRQDPPPDNAPDKTLPESLPRNPKSRVH